MWCPISASSCEPSWLRSFQLSTSETRQYRQAMDLHHQLHWRPLYKLWPIRLHQGRRCMYFCQKQFFTLLLIILNMKGCKLKTSSSNLSHSQAIQGVVAMEANKNVQSSSTPQLEQEVEISFIVRVSIWKLNNCIKTKLIDIKSFFFFLLLAI